MLLVGAVHGSWLQQPVIPSMAPSLDLLLSLQWKLAAGSLPGATCTA